MNLENCKFTLEANNREDIESPEPLRPCPMCSGDAVALLTSEWKIKHGEIDVVVRCDKCRVTTGKRTISSKHIENIRKGAKYAVSVEPLVNLMKIWNRRTATASVIGGVVQYE